MPRIDLQVPFSEKDEAKWLGARWDNERKVWYVPDGIDSARFQRWLPSELVFCVRSTTYFIAEAEKNCWKCNTLTRLYGFVLPPGHEIFESDEDGEGSGGWYMCDAPAAVHYITELLPSVINRMKEFSCQYRFDFSKTTQSSYWMNHCEHCNMKQGDFEMYCEPGGAFFPVSEWEARQIKLFRFDEPFACNGDAGYDDYLPYALT